MVPNIQATRPDTVVSLTLDGALIEVVDEGSEHLVSKLEALTILRSDEISPAMLNTNINRIILVVLNPYLEFGHLLGIPDALLLG